MRANSRPVASAQTDIHRNLAALVARHAGSVYRKPILDRNRTAFEAALTAWRHAGRAPLILDAGCGVGLSTLHLAQLYPDHYVIGVDQSADRLARKPRWHGEIPTNCIRIRADLVDFWRLLYATGERPARQYLLYPNPWPKIGQLARRWHGHPVFPIVVGLGGILECRSNWRIYVDECTLALSILSGKKLTCEPYAATAAITPFERKYTDSGHALWRCRVKLAPDSSRPCMPTMATKMGEVSRPLQRLYADDAS